MIFFFVIYALSGGCDPGQCRITQGYRLPAKHVIHTVGPIGEKPRILRSCYESALKKAMANNIRTLVCHRGENPEIDFVLKKIIFFKFLLKKIKNFRKWLSVFFVFFGVLIPW